MMTDARTALGKTRDYSCTRLRVRKRLRGSFRRNKHAEMKVRATLPGV